MTFMRDKSPLHFCLGRHPTEAQRPERGFFNDKRINKKEDGKMKDLQKYFESEHGDECVNIVDGLFAIAEGLNQISKAIHKLGLANADTPMGAIELLSSEISKVASSMGASSKPIG
jgi:hypothetical protein